MWLRCYTDPTIGAIATNTSGIIIIFSSVVAISLPMPGCKTSVGLRTGNAVSIVSWSGMQEQTVQWPSQQTNGRNVTVVSNAFFIGVLEAKATSANCGNTRHWGCTLPPNDHKRQSNGNQSSQVSHQLIDLAESDGLEPEITGFADRTSRHVKARDMFWLRSGTREESHWFLQQQSSSGVSRL